MSPTTEWLVSETFSPADGPGGYPFRGPGLLTRVMPFAVVAVLAEASMALPPGPRSARAAAVSAVLLVAVAAAFALPWSRLPVQLMVVVPLAYCGSALALILAAGDIRGLTAVVLVPLLWTALFHHRRWESACIVAAVVAVEVAISLIPAAAPDAVIARRAVLWAVMGALISVTVHGLRDRIQLSREKSAQLQDGLREFTFIADQDRIAVGLRDKVVQQIFAAGLILQGTAARITDPAARGRIQESVDDLDQVVRLLRDTIFGLDHRLQGRGLRAEILKLCRELSMAPELSFSGPVDGALQPTDTTQLLVLLRQALDLIGQDHTPRRIGIAAGEDSLLAVVEAAPVADAAYTGRDVHGFTRLREQALRAGIGLKVEPGPEGTRFNWHVPLSAARD